MTSISGGGSHRPNRVFLDRNNCRTRPARLVESHLRLTLHSSFTGLGSLHGILSKRRGKVVTDAMVEGTDLIQITATIPQAESFVSCDYYCVPLYLVAVTHNRHHPSLCRPLPTGSGA
jgi:hypothetical protein